MKLLTILFTTMFLVGCPDTDSATVQDSTDATQPADTEATDTEATDAEATDAAQTAGTDAADASGN
jgi:PBP1b-binding outer membrane lipoprotein LpoB|tara:strand:+ start:2627 stop:2824 length:198 start_codon:yes stop_codon:yes gene_type:complete